VYHSTLGWRVIKKKKKIEGDRDSVSLQGAGPGEGGWRAT